MRAVQHVPVQEYRPGAPGPQPAQRSPLPGDLGRQLVDRPHLEVGGPAGDQLVPGRHDQASVTVPGGRPADGPEEPDRVVLQAVPLQVVRDHQLPFAVLLAPRRPLADAVILQELRQPGVLPGQCLLEAGVGVDRGDAAGQPPGGVGELLVIRRPPGRIRGSQVRAARQRLIAQGQHHVRGKTSAAHADVPPHAPRRPLQPDPVPGPAQRRGPARGRGPGRCRRKRATLRHACPSSPRQHSNGETSPACQPRTTAPTSPIAEGSLPSRGG